MKWLIPLLALLACLPQRASAETTLGPVITTLPVTITHAGVFHLIGNLAFEPATGIAINVTGTGVTIDMNGHEIIALSGTNNSAIGINCANANRVTIKNGAILDFRTGMVLNSDNASVTDMLLTNDYGSGIIVAGNNAQILRNRVTSIGGAPTASVPYAIGISLSGTYGNISDNEVNNVFAPDLTGHYGNGIRLLNCSNVVSCNNRVLDVEPAAPTKGTSTGIATVSSDNLILLSNIVSTTQTGFDLSGAASGKYGDNITNDVTTQYNAGSGMTSIGNNN